VSASGIQSPTTLVGEAELYTSYSNSNSNVIVKVKVTNYRYVLQGTFTYALRRMLKKVGKEIRSHVRDKRSSHGRDETSRSPIRRTTGRHGTTTTGCSCARELHPSLGKQHVGVKVEVM
jgi:hypothetical protein